MDAFASWHKSHTPQSHLWFDKHHPYNGRVQPVSPGVSVRLGGGPIFQGSYSPFENTMFDAEDQSMPPREITDQSASPLIPNSLLQSAWIFASSYSPAPALTTFDKHSQLQLAAAEVFLHVIALAHIGMHKG